MKRKLIETALPLEAISRASAREKFFRGGHPFSLHLWWSRKPLAAARAFLFATLVDDPAGHPEIFPTPAAQSQERERLFRLIEGLVAWESFHDQSLLAAARAEIEKYQPGPSPLEFLDPFAGGGSLALAAQSLGLRVRASDLNPVAVMIAKASLEIPPRFNGRAPVNPGSQRASLTGLEWARVAGLAEDVAYYANLFREMAWAKVGHLYPSLDTVVVPGEDNLGKKLVSPQPLAWLWARTVQCPNPACGCQMPLVSSLALANRGDRQIYLDPSFQDNQVVFAPREGTPPRAGTFSRQGARCAICQGSVKLSYVKEEGRRGRLGRVLLAVVAQGQGGRVYLPPDARQIQAAEIPRPPRTYDFAIAADPRVISTATYGLSDYADFFTARQLTFLDTLVALLPEIEAAVAADARQAGWAAEEPGLEAGGAGATAYAQAVVVYLSFLVDKLADYNCSLCSWNNSRETVRDAFTRQSLNMVWDYAEANPFAEGPGSLGSVTETIVKAIRALPAWNPGEASLADAQSPQKYANVIISTDPPYYDSPGWANLADFFYMWLRPATRPIYQSVFKTIRTPKNDELIVDLTRFAGDRERARASFESGLRRVFANLFAYCSNDYPLSIYYAFKPTDSKSAPGEGVYSSTGLEIILAALIDSQFSVTGVWPVKTDLSSRPRFFGPTSLVSTIVLVARKNPAKLAPIALREFLAILRAELRPALLDKRSSRIAPVDLPRVALGPGMAVYSRYSQVLRPDGSALSVPAALGLINEELDYYFSELEGRLTGDTGLCVALFSRFGLTETSTELVETLAQAKSASLERLTRRGILATQAGQTRLLGARELPGAGEPGEDNIWLLTHQLARSLETGGLAACASLALAVASEESLERAQDLAYVLYSVGERKKMIAEAWAFNALVQAWPDLTATMAKLRGPDLEPKVGVGPKPTAEEKVE
ncbi:MAG: DUF1156 domain-containing protein [Deltaproteobacteria bacterium]|jgi:putative DNA methylase|nr:DUF1156 domain-containing protein [Deltaproteobacteria bacterium]